MMSNNMLSEREYVGGVAIMLATFNGENYLNEQIASLQNQTYKDWVLFIRDDGSSDSTLELISAAARKDCRIRLIESEKVSKGGAQANFATIFNYIKSKYVFDYYMFCDQDDIWLPSKIEESLNKCVIAESKQMGPILVHSDLKVVDRNLNIVSCSFAAMRSINPSICDLPHLLVQNNVTGCTMLWNNHLNEIVKFDNDFTAMHDWWVALTASLFGVIEYLDMPTVLYRQHDGNVVGAKKTNSISFILMRLKTIPHVKKTIEWSFIQASSLLKTYQNNLSDCSRMTIERFIYLRNKSKIIRIISLIKGGYLKQGFIQIVGELIFL